MNDSFLEALASPEQPVPGGGAAAAHTALVGLSLLQKIVGVERLRHSGNEGMGSFWENLSAGVTNSSRLLHGLRDEDGKRYLRLSAAKSAGKNDAAISEAIAQAIECPAKIMEAAGEAMDLVSPAAEHCKNHMLSDLLVAAELLGAARRGACRIAQANLRLCADPILTAEYRERLTQIDSRGRNAFDRLEGAIRKRTK